MSRRQSDVHVTREEFERLRQVVDDCCRKLETQFTRFAQIQAELDQIRRAWAKMAPVR